MRVDLHVLMDVVPLTEGAEVTEVVARDAAVHGVEEALKYAENRGFNHEHSDRVGMTLFDLSVARIIILKPCKFCRVVAALSTMERHGDGYVCVDCWDERLRTTA